MSKKSTWEYIRRRNPIIKRNAWVSYEGRNYRVANTDGTGVLLRDEVHAHPSDVKPAVTGFKVAYGALRISELEGQLEQINHEMEARANILNRAVEHRQRLFPDDIGNGWIDSIDRLANEIVALRQQLEQVRGIAEKLDKGFWG